MFVLVCLRLILNNKKTTTEISIFVVLLQHGADPNAKNSDGKSALDLADASTRPVLTGKRL